MGVKREGILDRDGNIRLIEPITAFGGPRRVLVEIEEIPTVENILDEIRALENSRTETISAETNEHVPFPLPRVVGRYKLLTKLGHGGMAETYHAEDTSTGSLVCLKQLYPFVNKRALMQECRALARLSHPYIVRLLDFDTMGESPYLAVEYVIGTPLNEFMRRAGALPRVTVVALGLRMFKAIAYAHSQDVIHRDLKPSNVIIAAPEDDLLPKVLDFGLAVVSQRDESDRVSAVHSFAGTVDYMSPEQIDGAKLTSACDVYALGQILWEMLVGKPAFLEGSFLEICSKKLAMKNGFLLDLEGSDEPLQQLISDCTLVDPSRRPAAAEAIEIIQGFSVV